MLLWISIKPDRSQSINLSGLSVFLSSETCKKNGATKKHKKFLPKNWKKCCELLRQATTLANIAKTTSKMEKT